LLVGEIVFRALLADSEYWRGLFLDAGSQSSSSTSSGSGRFPLTTPGQSFNIRQPLLGHALSSVAATSLALGMDGLRKRKVRLLHHAFLALGNTFAMMPLMLDRYLYILLGTGGVGNAEAILGAGSLARVYRGTYKGQRVAVKMVFCIDLTPLEVEKFVHEASLLSSLAGHPNVVRLIGNSALCTHFSGSISSFLLLSLLLLLSIGVCVRPPAICLVMELADYGSLFDLLYTPRLLAPTKATGTPAPNNTPEPSTTVAPLLINESKADSAASSSSSNGPPVLELSWSVRLMIAWQCARGVAFLHSYVPVQLFALVHTNAYICCM
jgi:hypothetical protein